MLKRLSLIIAASLISTSAFAAGNDWTGWYIGGHAGQSSGDSSADVTLGGQWSAESQALRDHVTSNWSTDLEPSGAAYGLQLGYNHQFASGLVLGGELDYSKLNADEARSTGLQPTTPFPSLSYNFSNSIDLNSKTSLRARIGYAPGNSLIYLTGGIAQVDVDAAASVASNGNYLKAGRESGNQDATEWGVGYEYDFGNQWTVRAEYLRTDVDDLNFDTVYLPGSSFVTPAYNESFKQGLDFSTLRVGFNYRF